MWDFAPVRFMTARSGAILRSDPPSTPCRARVAGGARVSARAGEGVEWTRAPRTRPRAVPRARRRPARRGLRLRRAARGVGRDGRHRDRPRPALPRRSGRSATALDPLAVLGPALRARDAAAASPSVAAALPRTAPTGWCGSGWRPPRDGDASRRGRSSARSRSPTTADRGSGGSRATSTRPRSAARSPRTTSSASAAPRSPSPVCSCRLRVGRGLDVGSGCGIQALRARRDVARRRRDRRLGARAAVHAAERPAQRRERHRDAARVAVRAGRGRAVRPRRLQSAVRHHPAGRRSARVRVPRRRNAGR